MKMYNYNIIVMLLVTCYMQVLFNVFYIQVF